MNNYNLEYIYNNIGNAVEIDIEDIRSTLKNKINENIEIYKKTITNIKSEKTCKNLKHPLKIKLKPSEFRLYGMSQNNKIKYTNNHLFKEIDKYIYKQKWSRLSQQHKIIKIKEYIEIKILNTSNKKKILEKIEQLIIENKFKTKKYIIYDQNTEQIINMPVLKFDDEKNKYIINE